MLKFDLARKYLVGLLTVAMVMSLLVLPVTASPEPVVNASHWTVDITQTDTYNPVDNPTHVVTIYTYVDSTLGDPAKGVSAATAGGDPLAIITPSITATRVSTGVYTATIVYGTHVPDTPGTYSIFGFIDADSSGGISEGDVISSAIFKEWAIRFAHEITVEPETAENDILDTHTITATIKDQFGDLFDPDIVTYSVTGFNEGRNGNLTGSSAGVYTGSYSSRDPAYPTDVPPFKDTITVSAGGATGTAEKIWGYIPSYKSAEISLEAYNMVGAEHEVSVSFFDQYGYPIAITATVDFTVTGVNPTSETVFGEDVTELSFAYVGKEAGTDVISAALTVNDELGDTLTTTKHWAWEWDVTPEHEVNALGAEHVFDVWGAPGDEVTFTFISAGIFSLDDLLVWDEDNWDRASDKGHWQLTLDAYGEGEILVMSQAPGKFFCDVTFEPALVDKGLLGTTNDPYGRLTGVTIKVSKAFAQLTGFDITSDDINPITQVAAWDTHTVEAVALGEFPVKPSTVIPPGPPPEGGEYILIGDTLWVINAPVGGVSVDWEVLWDYCADGVTVDVFADRILDETYVDGGETDSYHQDGNPLTVTHWLHATSVTDGNGQAYLTYHMEYWGKGEESTCTYHFPCLVDHITVTGGYGIPALDQEYGTITETAEKEWRDYELKVYKFHDNTQNPNNYIGDTKFFLRRLDIVGTPTYVPPMPADHPWVIGGYTEAVEDPNGPGNAALVIDTDPPGVVTTFDSGPEKGAAIWYHLPDGVYGLYEYSVPSPWAPQGGLLYEFTIDDNQPIYWCADTKIITIYIENTISPTQVYFYKLNDCWSVLPDAVFQATRLDTHAVFGPFTSDEFGKVVLEDLTYDPVNGSEYMVEEIEAPEGFFPVAPFYFKLDKNGVWDDKFYDELNKEVYAKVAHPETGVVQHWVKDPSQGTPPVQPVEIALDLMKGWNLVGVGLDVNDTVKNLFGDDFLRAFRWDPTLPGPYGENGTYFSYGNMVPEPGKGFWVKMAAAGEVTIEGTAVESPVSFDLSEGWEQIANPFDEEIPWTNVTIDGMSMEDAYAAGIIGRAFSWNGTTYEIANFGTGTLGVGQGFWLRVKADCTIEFTK